MPDTGWPKYHVLPYVPPKKGVTGDERYADSLEDREVFRLSRCLSPVGREIIKEYQRSEEPG